MRTVADTRTGYAAHMQQRDANNRERRRMLFVAQGSLLAGVACLVVAATTSLVALGVFGVIIFSAIGTIAIVRRGSG